MRLSPTPRLRALFDDYRDYHRTKGNTICHYFGIPFIMITLLGLLGLWGGAALLAFAIGWYFLLDWKIAIPFSVYGVGTLILGLQLDTTTLWTGFVLGWVLQFVGHGVFEKKSPAFLRNIKHVLIGPLWVFAKWTNYEKLS